MQHLVVPGMWSVKIGWNESMLIGGCVIYLDKINVTLFIKPVSILNLK